MTPASRDVSVYLEDIMQAVAHIDTYVAGMAFDAFALDTKTQDAVVRNLEIIGEAVKRLPDDFRATHPDIAWRPAAAMRDFLIHEYPEVDVQAVWDTIKNDLPSFRYAIETLSRSEAS